MSRTARTAFIRPVALGLAAVFAAAAFSVSGCAVTASKSKKKDYEAGQYSRKMKRHHDLRN